MAEIKLRNRSGKSLKAGTYVKYLPSDPTAFTESVMIESEVIGILKESTIDRSLGVVELLSAGEIELTKEAVEAVLTGEIITHTHPSGGGALAEEFETVSKNLKSYPYTFTYGVDGLASITYDIGGGDSIVKTLNYTLGILTSIVLSGDTPAGISLTKTLNYTGDDLTSVVYS